MKEKGLVFGQKCVASLAKYDQNMQLLKTYQCSFIEDLNVYSATLPKSGMIVNGRLSEQTMLVHGTEEKEFGLWRTPDAHLGMRGAKSKEGYEDSLKNGTHAINLLDQVKHNFEPKFLPTPTTQETEHPLAELTKTGRRKAKNGKTSHSLNLADTIVIDKEGGRQNTTGQLNPTWVEWLMGFPTGWTDLKDSETQ